MAQQDRIPQSSSVSLKDLICLWCIDFYLDRVFAGGKKDRTVNVVTFALFFFLSEGTTVVIFTTSFLSYAGITEDLSFRKMTWRARWWIQLYVYWGGFSSHLEKPNLETNGVRRVELSKCELISKKVLEHKHGTEVSFWTAFLHFCHVLFGIHVSLCLS